MSILEYQSWESSHFGKKIYRLSNCSLEKSDIDKKITRSNVDLIQCKCPLSDLNCMNDLLSYGFEFVSTAVTFRKEIKKNDYIPEEILIAELFDLKDLKEIARSSFSYSRFNYPVYNQALVQSFYSIWVEKSITSEFDDTCIVVKDHGVIIGFLTLRSINDITYRVGLLAVRSNYRRMGVGATLLKRAVSFVSELNGCFLEIDTQYENKGAVDFYKKEGLIIDSLSVWLYLSPK